MKKSKGTRTYKANVYVSESDLVAHPDLKFLYERLGLEDTLYWVWGFDIKSEFDTDSGSWYTTEKLMHKTRLGVVKDEVRYSGYERTDESWLTRQYPIKCSDAAKLAAKGDPTLIKDLSRLGSK